MQESSTNDTTHPAVLAFRQDLEQQLREHVREAIETVLEAELTAALGSGRHERTARRAGSRHGTVDRTLTTRDGVRQLRVPRGRVRHADGTTREFRSQLIPRYTRRTREVDAAILSSYLAGANSRRIRAALRPLLGEQHLSKSAVSRIVGRVDSSSASDTRHLTPDTEGLCSQEPMMDGPQEMAADTKEILHGSVHREKSLRVGTGFEPAHLALPLPGRLVGDFRPVVRVLVRAVNHGRHHGAAGRGVTAQLVGDQSSRDTARSFQQLPEEAYRRPPIAPGLHEIADHVAVFIDGRPQILLPPLDLDEQLVRQPGVAHAAPVAPQPPSVGAPERPTPLPNRSRR